MQTGRTHIIATISQSVSTRGFSPEIVLKPGIGTVYRSIKSQCIKQVPRTQSSTDLFNRSQPITIWFSTMMAAAKRRTWLRFGKWTRTLFAFVSFTAKVRRALRFQMILRIFTQCAARRRRASRLNMVAFRRSILILNEGRRTGQRREPVVF